MKNFLLTFLIGCGLFLLPGCTGIQKAIDQAREKKANRFFLENPDKAAAYCAAKFPGRDSIGEATYDSSGKADNPDHTALIDSMAQEAEKIDAAWFDLFRSYGVQLDTTVATYLASYKVKSDSLSRLVKSLQVKYQPCKPDTIRKEVPHYKIDGAAQKALDAANKKIAQLEGDNQAVRGQARTRLWMFIAACAVILLLLILFFKTKK